MDKTGLKKYVMTIFRIFGFMYLICIPIILLFGLLSSISNGDFSIGSILSSMFSMVISGALALLLLLGIILFVGFLVYLANVFILKRNTVQTKEYYRDIPNTYSPAIASAVLDLNTEITTDYPATISYLCAKKYIEMNEESDGNISFTLLDNNTSSLTIHEQYVLDCLFNGTTFNNDSFKSRVKQDAINLGLVKEGRRKIHFLRNVAIAIGSFIFFGITLPYVPENTFIGFIYNLLAFVSMFSVFAVFFGSLYFLVKYQNENYHRTSLGNKDAKKWSAFKNFLHDYTLISDKDLKHVQILDEYIPYAICLGEGKTIEKFVSNNNVYRKFLYKYHY